MTTHSTISPLEEAALHLNIRLSVFQNGVLVREPALLTIIGLRETLLMVEDIVEAKVNVICRTITENGRCTLGGAADDPFYVIERIPS